jgi:hypothetical protein
MGLKVFKVKSLRKKAAQKNSGHCPLFKLNVQIQWQLVAFTRRVRRSWTACLDLQCFSCVNKKSKPMADARFYGKAMGATVFLVACACGTCRHKPRRDGCVLCVGGSGERG